MRATGLGRQPTCRHTLSAWPPLKSVADLRLGTVSLLRRETLGRHFEMLKLKAGRYRAADQGEVALAARHLPLAGRHHQLRHLGLVDVVAQNVPVLADRDLQRRAAIEMPDLGGIDAVPARDLPALEQEIDGGRMRPAFAIVVPARMRMPPSLNVSRK